MRASKHSKAKKTKKSIKNTTSQKNKTHSKLAGALKTTTVFTNGQSQAIRIPKEFRVAGKKVYIKKSGNCLMIIPINSDPWKIFFEALGEFSDDFMKDGRQQPENQERDWKGVFE